MQCTTYLASMKQISVDRRAPLAMLRTTKPMHLEPRLVCAHVHASRDQTNVLYVHNQSHRTRLGMGETTVVIDEQPRNAVT